jgi:hypothetical protein
MQLFTGMALVACMLAAGGTRDEPKVLFRTGSIRVLEDQYSSLNLGGPPLTYNYLMRADTHFGLSFHRPQRAADLGNPEADYSRLPATYHHPFGPAGVAMSKFDWFRDPKNPNTFRADVRMPVSLVGLGAMPVAFGNLPAEQLVDLWSEPPIAVIGMYVGEMAGYARPFQYIDIYENDPRIIKLSMPDKGDPYFWYIHDAKKRGAIVRVFQGPERKTIAAKAPDRFYHAIFVEMSTHEQLEQISIDLLTREGMSVLFKKLADEGILGYHTSNRYFNLIPIVTDLATSQGYAVREGHDTVYEQNATPAYVGHFSSNWVMVARKPIYLKHLKEPAAFKEVAKAMFAGREPFYWNTPRPSPDHRYAWSDKDKHTLRGLIWPYGVDPLASRLDNALTGMIANYMKYRNKHTAKPEFPLEVMRELRSVRPFSMILGPILHFLREETGQTFEALYPSTAKSE